MAGQFGDVEAMFEVQSIVNELPILFGSSGNPGFSYHIIHGSKSFSDNRVPI